MLPQIGIEILGELGITNGRMLDPYCGTGSSFIAGLDRGISEMHGFDINPLAVLISRAKFTKIDLEKAKTYQNRLKNQIIDFVEKNGDLADFALPQVRNIHFWFSDKVLHELAIIKHFLDKITETSLQRLFLVPFSETIRECSFTRNNEFKLYRMRVDDMLNFKPNAIAVYFGKLDKALKIYEHCYYPRLRNAKIKVKHRCFKEINSHYDVVLTSPPYGDSKTTVAYGQFSMFSNEWLGIDYARKIDCMLMGGKNDCHLYDEGIIADYIGIISKTSHTRALQVSSFYRDLEQSINQVATSVTVGGKVIYIVGNRRVKEIQLPTDQFIAEKFKENGFQHLFTYQRILGNKSMPLVNSPTNKKNKRGSTITREYIVVCEKRKGN